MIIHRRLLAQLFILLVSCSTASASGELLCRTEPTEISVASSEQSIRETACGAVLNGIAVLESCGLVQSTAIAVEVGDEPLGRHPNCLGIYDCESEHVYVLTPDAMSKVLPDESPFRAIPLQTLFASIVTHELAHALLFQMRDGAGETIAEDEYVAYAMQYLSLTEHERKALLGAMPAQTSYVTREMLNDFFLTMSPVTFGSWAWRHFEKQEDGCSFISAIVSGEIDFTPDAASQCLDPPECTINR